MPQTNQATLDYKRDVTQFLEIIAAEGNVKRVILPNFFEKGKHLGLDYDWLTNKSELFIGYDKTHRTIKTK